MTIDALRDKGCIVLESVSGSRAYGLHTAQSDTDIKGVFILPEDDFFGLNYVGQVNNESNDVVFYELKRFVELLTVNNPNIMELLAIPEDCLVYRHPLMERFRAQDFISKLCKETFAGYAMTQVQKARGLNKKIMNPMDERRKSVLEFCYVQEGQGSIPLLDFLDKKGLHQSVCGVSKIPHMYEAYGLYYDENGPFKGIVVKESANEISLSSIPKELSPIGILWFNKDGYSKYCKDYKAYWEWVENRNHARYENTLQHGKNYDAKNMMHTFRLLAMAEEIGTTGKINVRRNDRDELLQIKNGKYTYETLVEMAEQRVSALDVIYDNSTLPQKPDPKQINRLLFDVRKAFYDNI